MATSPPTQDSYLVIGGCGFVGRHIVEQLLARGEKSVAVFDLVQRHFDDNVTFYTGDICFAEDIGNAINKSRANVVIHTASPIHGQSAQLYEKVNITGTLTVISSCLSSSTVRKLVYTSSAGVVYSGSENLADVDERISFPEKALDAYNDTKARAEVLVLQANGKQGGAGRLLTCALRPAGIFGEGDKQLLVGLKQVKDNGQTKFQIGSNENLFDWTYVGNVAHAHLLAADKLDKVLSADELTYPLKEINKSTGDYRIPTSKAKPLGPVKGLSSGATAEEQAADDAFRREKSLDSEDDADLQPVLRTKMDQFAKATEPLYVTMADNKPITNGADGSDDDDDEKALAERGVNKDLRVAGQCYFITNAEPLYFWDIHRTVWYKGMNHIAPYIIKLPVDIGMILANLAVLASKFTGREPGFTPFRVKFATQKRWYNVERARRLLGYEPIYGVEEGIKRTCEWFNAEEARKAAAK